MIHTLKKFKAEKKLVLYEGHIYECRRRSTFSMFPVKIKIKEKIFNALNIIYKKSFLL